MKKLLPLIFLIFVCNYYNPSFCNAFRMGDKGHLTALASQDKVLVEDYSDASNTKYTTMDDINTYLGSIYQPLTAYLTDLGDGNITSNFVNTTYPWADNEVANAQTITAQAGSTWDIANSITALSVYTGTVSLEQHANATASGAAIVGCFDDFTNSANETDVQGTLKNFDTALEIRCLESIFGTSIGPDLLLVGTILKTSTILQKYHGVDPSVDVLAMLGSANDTTLVTEIGAEPALTNEAAFYARISDVSQFYEQGDNITTAYGTTPPTTCSVGQIFIDTDADTDGSVLVCVSTNTWKDVGMGPDKDKIIEGDSNWEIIDAGTGQADCDIDGQLKVRINSDGLDVNGTISGDSIEVGAIVNPRVRALDSDSPGTDKFAGSIDWQYVSGADGAENSDIYLQSMEGGANTTQAKFDESESIWEFNGNFIEFPNGTADVVLPQVGAVHFNETDEQVSFHSGTNGEISGEAAISLIYHRTWSFDPDAVCDGAVDRLFLMTIGDDAPEGIIIDEWKVSFEADPTTEADLDLKRADAFIGVTNAAVMDVLDTTTGTSSEDTDANINAGAAVANGKVMYLEFGTAYTETTHQIIFELWYHCEED
jgi:hypothetical protein